MQPKANVITSIQFRGFRILEDAVLPLSPFNLLLGPNSSGKTTAVNALLALGDAAAAQLAGREPSRQTDLAGATAEFQLGGEFAGATAMLRFDAGGRVSATFHEAPGGTRSIVAWLAQVRGYTLDAAAIARPVPRDSAAVLQPDGGGLAAVLSALRHSDGPRWQAFIEEFRRLLPDHVDVIAGETVDGVLSFSVRLAQGRTVKAQHLSQGTLVILALLALAFSEKRPTVLCLEEIERGIHPRLLREVRDSLYRLSFPGDWGDTAAPVQVITTTHSPYILDLFADTPEDVILATKGETGATFKRLSDVPELTDLVQNGRLGDLWYSGIFGGVP